MYFYKRCCISVAIISGLSLTGCIYTGDDDEGDGNGYAQYVNLVPQSPDIEFVVDDDSEGELSFTEATAYSYVSNVSYDIEFNQILPNTENSSFIDDETLKVDKKKVHSYILYGETDYPSSLEIEIDVSDVYDSDFDDGYAMVQFANLASYDDAVDVYILDADGSLTNQTASYTLSLADTSGDTELDAGDYKLVFTQSGTDTILAMKNDITIEEGEALSYVLVSYESAGIEDTFFSIVELNNSGSRQLTNEAQDSYLRVSNNITNTNAISVAQTTSSNIVAEDIAFGDISDFISIEIDEPDEATNVDVYLHDSDTQAVLESTSIDFYADQVALLLGSGNTNSTVTSYSNTEDLRVIETHAKLLFSHNIDNESSTAISVKVIEQGSSPDSYDESDSFSYLSSLDVEIEAGDYDVYVYNSETNDLLLETTIYDVQTSDVINLILSDYDYGGAPYQVFTVYN
ncbi:DUF4397 domain-containing protein [Alteromonas sp. 1_MG-2023]|uniref:DUF4397 domain-containing protein n=1 Tax=Alteromonas sp. 1_MG-2023 TaxID=3062669 RepID=UPI0026E4302E|nr:DUF4397 domain-containing protein [Alteromonas sp. 1_MG-2023]MDO6568570.1 DUF4397 domain-containing protein [Alteromonas sp. 1_MG-2023]